MINSERMSKLIITAPKSFLDKTIRELYRLNAIHIVNHKAAEIDIGMPLENASKISETLIAVRAIISKFGLESDIKLKNGFKAVGMKNFAELARTVKHLQEEINSKNDRIKKLETEVKKLEPTKNALVQLSKLGMPFDSYETSSIKFFVGYVPDAELLEKELSSETQEFQLHSASQGRDYLIALFVPNSLRHRVSDILARNVFSELDISSVAGMKGSVNEALSSVSAKHDKLLKAISDIEKHLNKLSARWHDFLILSEQLLSIELEKAETPLRFAASENMFVVTGWVPTKKAAGLTERLEKITHGNVHVEVNRPSYNDNIPVKLANVKHARPFEFFMNLYALPKYGEIDPTLFLSFTFPLFFGIILGDVGYGIAIALLMLYLAKKFPSIAPLTMVMMPAALSSILFGFVFGEIFGFEELFGYQIPHLISRVHEIQQMLIISIIIGFIHVNFGILVGFINELSHGLKKAILVKGSWWVMEIGIALVALASMGMLNLSIYVGGIVFVLGIVMLTLGEPMAVVEIPALISNILSYSRLMAVGLASVGLAVVINGFVEDFAAKGGLMILAAILVGVVGHAINIALGLLGGFLHSIRLHYVEFFTKFFKGGAIPFEAFGNRGLGGGMNLSAHKKTKTEVR